MKQELLKLWEIPLSAMREFTQEELAGYIKTVMGALKKVLEVEQNLCATSLESHLANYPGKGLQLVVYLKVKDDSEIVIGQQAELNFEELLPLPSGGNLEELIEEDFGRLSARWKAVQEAVKATPSVLAELNIAAYFDDGHVRHPKYKLVKQFVAKVPKNSEKKVLATMLGQEEFLGFNSVEWDPNCYLVRALITRTEKGYLAKLIKSDVPVKDAQKFELDRPSDAAVDDALNKAERERVAINLSIRVGRPFGTEAWTRGRVQAVMPDDVAFGVL